MICQCVLGNMNNALSISKRKNKRRLFGEMQNTLYKLAMASVYTHDAHCAVSYS